MATYLSFLAVDSADPSGLGRFWAELLDWHLDDEDPGEVLVESWGAEFMYRLPGETALIFYPAAEPKITKNRIHLDLAATSLRHQDGLVERALGLGAARIDIGQGNVPWHVLADPEGNEFCVLEPRETYVNTGSVAAMVVDCADKDTMATFWTAATGWPVVNSDAYVTALRSPEGTGPFLEMLAVGEPAPGNNRLRPAVAPRSDGGLGPQAEADRLAGFGAKPVGAVQSAGTAIVLTDPESQEFWLLNH